MALTSLQGKTALITGGATGIGLGLATIAGRQGARVALASTNLERLHAAEAKLAAEGIEAMSAQLDVTSGAQWKDAVAAVTQKFGPIDFLALNAGVAPVMYSVEDTPIEQWEWSLSVNLMGAVHGLRTCLPDMKKRGQDGHILITSSIAALDLPPMMSSYDVPKAGLVALAEVLRKELAPTPIGVSVMIPGAVRTDLAEISAKKSPNAAPEVYSLIGKMLSQGLDPLDVGEFVMERVKGGHFYILTHNDMRGGVSARFNEILTEFETAV